jgi:hypothetical protein
MSHTSNAFYTLPSRFLPISLCRNLEKITQNRTPTRHRAAVVNGSATDLHLAARRLKVAHEADQKDERGRTEESDELHSYAAKNLASIVVREDDGDHQAHCQQEDLHASDPKDRLLAHCEDIRLVHHRNLRDQPDRGRPDPEGPTKQNQDERKSK